MKTDDLKLATSGRRSDKYWRASTGRPTTVSTHGVAKVICSLYWRVANLLTTHVLMLAHMNKSSRSYILLFSIDKELCACFCRGANVTGVQA